ncbi:chromate transporter [Mycoplasma todarodis]|uniref:chromate transporter n=1 Tax=Mycoplasma todarodis TaxID=1937191 RepID=UPI003B296096
MKNKEKKQNSKVKDFFKVLVFILKATFLGYGGGNALMPIIRKFAVVENGWLDDEEFDDVVIASNMIPGPSVVEALSYVAIKKLGKLWGTVVTIIGILPHMLMALAIFVLSTKYLPPRYLWIINVAIMPIIIAILILFIIRYVKQSRKELALPVMITLIIGAFGFCMFIPAPYNIPAILMIATIFVVFVVEFIRIRRHKKDVPLTAEISSEKDDVEVIPTEKEDTPDDQSSKGGK